MYNQFESLSPTYDQDEKKRQKSANEIAKFILNGLEERQQFFEFICGEEINDKKAGRWQEQLLNLVAKAQKRIGYQIDSQELLMAARQVVLDQAANGELAELKAYKKFCELSPEDFRLRA
jgi:hypothetical protein